ncbi:juvenile hormone epoxide hydrolase 1-like [Coccinella septempunctata]|uniref:juvenile hormone epoxide hydrolase 1-like n=1 Tax=Coccinella septempunctata TaxID=41139 RepID=UPI001D05D261|nr:juvenile hormone epoxide hydrolase 1-like [Coccinella septempunctata]
MGHILKAALSVAFLAIGFGIFKISSLFQIPEVPHLEETWWGEGVPSVNDDAVYSFKINVSDEVLQDLKYRLKNTRALAPALEGVQHEYGTNSKFTKSIIDFWLNKYDWKQREKYMNQYPQYKTKIQGLNIHFLHVKPEREAGKKVIPILMMHGWPGSVREFYEIIGLLTRQQEKRDFVFEVIAPSLPGFGFSDPALRPGLGKSQVAVVMKNLMKRLNHHKFYVHGEDFGSIIANDMAILFPENVIAMHSTMCASLQPISALKRVLYSLKPSLIVDEKHEHVAYPLSNLVMGIMEEFGAFHMHCTKPDTVGAALSDSPAGLAAYILEKFITWTNPNWRTLEDGGLAQKFKMEDLLDNIMIYWISDSIGTSLRIYAETYNKGLLTLGLEDIPVPVPAGCARFIHDYEWNPTALIEDKYPKLIHVTDYDGGHFAALENAEILAEDIFEFVSKVQKMNVLQ